MSEPDCVGKTMETQEITLVVLYQQRDVQEAWSEVL